MTFVNCVVSLNLEEKSFIDFAVKGYIILLRICDVLKCSGKECVPILKLVCFSRFSSDVNYGMVIRI